ncbi:glycosyltransferase [Rubripirellula reticaptiva]|uniref:Glycosyltransferase Gtf1 n=1 Tax=Rubripirellula reticaptiva TaxID=2528013 RepID=A0A5C6FC55_9BACT|nr:glycosyltransferase [Rubripirellula reticaptiva]TWU57884.1 Glycosyltransferase Gtf1 [Rubripirellula reticaptiva]
MYLIAIHVPIHVDGAGGNYLATDWIESLRLLRDSLEGRFGPIAVIAPSCAYDPEGSSQTLERVDAAGEGFQMIPSFNIDCSIRDYWLKHRSGWKQQLRDAVSKAKVVHSGLDDVYRPISYEGFLEGVRQGRTTVFVQDTDISVQCRQLHADRDILHRGLSVGYSKMFERWTRKSVGQASLSLLKGQQLIDRYGGYAKNAKLFHDTSYSIDDIVSLDFIVDRCHALSNRVASGRAPRFVYCGRLTPRKGIVDSIDIVAKCHELGVPIEFDIIGHGEQLDQIEKRIDELKMRSAIRMLGRMAYGPELFEKLRSYDGLLFTPLAEDTPRMIFDGYATGLPLIAYDIDYCVERQSAESATFLMPRGDIENSAKRLAELAMQPEKLTQLSEAAHEAAIYHAAENWYRRRAQWTFEAAEKNGTPMTMPLAVTSS